jgi:hypothetical protein
MRAISLLMLATMTAFAGEPYPADAPYIKHFDPVEAFLAAKELAKRGEPDALRTMFLCVYVRVNQPFLQGHGEEEMDFALREVIHTLGDDRFSGALAAQRPEIRAALASFFSLLPDEKPRFPRTAKLLHDAPKIDWPLDKAQRDDAKQ